MTKLKNKIDYEYIEINNISAHGNSKISFNKNVNITPIIGLNGSGKTIFLELLSQIFDDEFKEKHIPKFTRKNTSKYDEDIQFINIKLDKKIKYETSKPYFNNLDNEFLKRNSKYLNGIEGFIKIALKLNGDSVKRYYFIPYLNGVEGTLVFSKKFISELNDSENKKSFKDFSKANQMLMKENLKHFESISLTKKENKFLTEDNSEFKNIIQNFSVFKESVYYKILSKVDDDWFNKFKKHRSKMNKNQPSYEMVNLVEDLNNELNNIINGKYLSKNALKFLESIHNNLGGRRFIFGEEGPEPIKTNPIIKIINVINEDNEHDINMNFLFLEKDGNDKNVEFSAIEKNDGFNLFFWYIVYVNFLLEDIENCYILIDELGNYLNPRVIDNFISLLENSKHKTIFTTHNPYSIKIKYIDSIHVSVRNSNDNFMFLRSLDSEDRHKLISDSKDKNSNETLRIIKDALSISEDLLDWRISDSKINIFVEGLSEVVLFNVFYNGQDIRPILMNGCSEAYSNISKVYSNLLNKDIKFFAIVDSDWERDRTGTKNFSNKFELSKYNEYIKKMNEISEFKEIEDLFLSTNLKWVENFRDKNNISKEVVNLNQINEKGIKEEFKSICLSNIISLLRKEEKDIVNNIDNEYKKIFTYVKELIKKVI